MLFSSLTFLFGFLPITLISYFLINNRTYRNIVLLIFSLIFYAWGEPTYVFLMLLVVGCVYVAGLLIEYYKNDPSKKKTVLITSTVIVFSFLFYFKYINFFFDALNSLFTLSLTPVQVILPIGISFFTFQAISYVFDLYKGDVKVQKVTIRSHFMFHFSLN